MTREEFNRRFGSTFFVKLHKWGHQMTDGDVVKMGYALTGSAKGVDDDNAKTNSGRAKGASSISINTRR